jgi:hypothetical protein
MNGPSAHVPMLASTTTVELSVDGTLTGEYYPLPPPLHPPPIHDITRKPQVSSIEMRAQQGTR